jgi:hypothetical protein
MKLQKNKDEIQKIAKQDNSENGASFKEIKEKAETLELKIDTQNNRITKLLSSIEKMTEMNIQLIMTIEEMLYSIHHPQDNIENIVQEIKNEQKEVDKIKNWVKIN